MSLGVYIMGGILLFFGTAIVGEWVAHYFAQKRAKWIPFEDECDGISDLDRTLLRITRCKEILELCEEQLLEQHNCRIGSCEADELLQVVWGDAKYAEAKQQIDRMRFTKRKDN